MLHRQLLVWFVGLTRRMTNQYKQGEGMSKGRCLCGEVQFSVAGHMGEVRYCHCSMCRRVTGSAFSANARVRVELVNRLLRNLNTNQVSIELFVQGVVHQCLPDWIQIRTIFVSDSVRLKLQRMLM